MTTTGRVAIVTGAANGLGQEFAVALTAAATAARTTGAAS